MAHNTQHEEPKSLSLLQAVEQELVRRGIVSTGWYTEVEERAERVRLYRDYYDGDHRIKLSGEAQKMLNVSDNHLDQLNANYCELVVDSFVDRLKVEQIASDDETAQAWSADVMDSNRFDALQADVHHAAARDGDTYVWVDHVEGDGVQFTHEEAYDGDEGMFVVYDRQGRTIEAAVKIWREASIGMDDFFVRVYFREPGADGSRRWEKYLYKAGDEGGMFREETDVADHAEDFVPVLHFKNGARGRDRFGKGALRNVIPLVDALNATLSSMVMTALLSAFRLLITKGFSMSAGLAPGAVIEVASDLSEKMASMSADQLKEATGLIGSMGVDTVDAGDISQIIAQYDKIVEQISIIGRTPIPSLMGGLNESGEALKMRENPLKMNVEGFQVKTGNTWEDVLTMGARMQSLYGSADAPTDARWSTQWWKAHEVNVEKAKLLDAMGFQREALREMGYDDEAINKMMAERQEREGFAMAMAQNSMPQFGANGRQPERLVG